MKDNVTTFDDVDSWHKVTITDFGGWVRVKLTILPGRAHWTEPDAKLVRGWVDYILGNSRERVGSRQRTQHTPMYSVYRYEVEDLPFTLADCPDCGETDARCRCHLCHVCRQLVTDDGCGC